MDKEEVPKFEPIAEVDIIKRKISIKQGEEDELDVEASKRQITSGK